MQNPVVESTANEYVLWPVSEARAAWAAAFVAAQAELPEISKDKKATIPTKAGKEFSYSYADLPVIIKAVRPILQKHKLAFAQSLEEEGDSLACVTRIYHEAGHCEVFGPVLLPSGDDARSVGSAATYARRYGLCAALGIAADEDDDGEAAPTRTKRGSGKRPAAPSEPHSGQPAPTPTQKAVASAEAVANRKQVEDLRKELDWAPSKVLAFARKNGLEVSSSKLADWPENAVEAMVGLLTGEILKVGEETE